MLKKKGLSLIFVFEKGKFLEEKILKINFILNLLSQTISLILFLSQIEILIEIKWDLLKELWKS